MNRLKNMREADEFDFTGWDDEKGGWSDEAMAIAESPDDMPDGYFDVGEDDIWADDYYGDDDDIEKTDLAESPDDEDFIEIDEDDVDIEDPAYWENAKEIDPNGEIEYSDDDIAEWNDKDPDAGAEPIHYGEEEPSVDIPNRDSFRKILSLEDMPESKSYTRRRVRESDIMSIVDMMNNDDAIRARLGRGPFYKAEEVTPEMVEMAAAKVGKSPNSIRNFLKAYLDPDYEGPVSMGESKMRESFETAANRDQRIEAEQLADWIIKVQPISRVEVSNAVMHIARDLNDPDRREMDLDYVYNYLSKLIYKKTGSNFSIYNLPPQGQEENPEYLKSLPNFYKKKVKSNSFWYESKRVYGKRMNEDMALFCNNKPKDENREIPEWVMKAFHESKGNSKKFKYLCESYMRK